MADMAIDSRMSEAELCGWATKRVYMLFPVPDVTFLLDLDETRAFARKSDVKSISDLANRRRVYFRLSMLFPMNKVVASDPFDVVQLKIRTRVSELSMGNKGLP
jgi:thymidylate kinase